MKKIFGHFLDNLPRDRDFLELTFAPTSRPAEKCCRNCRLSAYFVADYCLNLMPRDSDDAIAHKRRQENRAAVSFIANELLENAIKFNENTVVKFEVKLGIQLFKVEDFVAIIFAQNLIGKTRAESLQNYIHQLLDEDLEELYVRQVEKTAREDAGESGLGLLTTINDYGARLGWKFETCSENPDFICLTTAAQVTL
ncbi:MAG: DUF6272 family protein [Limnospira sp.]